MTFKEYITLQESLNHDEGDMVMIAAGPHKGIGGMIEKILPSGMYQVMIPGGGIITMLGADLIPGDEYEFDWSKAKKRNFAKMGRKPMGPYNQLQQSLDN